MRDATLREMMNYFSSIDRPVTPPEFTEFWRELSDTEKAFYKSGIGELLGLE